MAKHMRFRRNSKGYLQCINGDNIGILEQPKVLGDDFTLTLNGSDYFFSNPYTAVRFMITKMLGNES